MRFLGPSVWVFGEARRCEVVPRHPYKPCRLYGLFVRWHEASERRIYLPCPHSLLSSALFFSFLLLLLLFVLTLHPSHLVSRTSHFNFILRCPPVSRVNFPFSLFRAGSTSFRASQEISTKVRRWSKRLFFHNYRNGNPFTNVTT